MKGKFILVVGTSGSGKNTLIEHAQSLFPEILYAKSCVTRPPRQNEDSTYRHFLSGEEFRKKVDAGEFLEWAEYGGNLYGTLKSEVLPHIAQGKTVLKELEVQGARQIQAKMPKDELYIIFINAGSWQEVETRIRGRAPITDDELLKRKAHYEDEMSFMKEAHVVVENKTGKLEEAKDDFEAAVRIATNITD